MRIALLANLAQNAPEWPGMPPDRWAYLDTWQTIDAVIIALEQAGHQVIFLEGDETLYNNLQAVEPDLCFNLCQGRFGRNRTAHIPAILEMLGLPYTGSGPLPLSLVLETTLTRRMLTCEGLPVPAFQVFETVDAPLEPDLQFPLRVKMSRAAPHRPLEAGVIVYDEPQLRAEVGQLLRTAPEPVLVEQVRAGREIVVGLVGNLRPPAARRELHAKRELDERFADTAQRLPEDRNSAEILAGLQIFPPLEMGSAPSSTTMPPLFPAALTEKQHSELQWLAAAVFRVLGGHDLAQMTLHLEAGAETFTVVAVDLLPSLTPGVAGLPVAAEAAGWSYETLINRLLLVTLERHQLSRQGQPASRLPPISMPFLEPG